MQTLVLEHGQALSAEYPTPRQYRHLSLCRLLFTKKGPLKLVQERGSPPQACCVQPHRHL